MYNGNFLAQMKKIKEDEIEAKKDGIKKLVNQKLSKVGSVVSFAEALRNPSRPINIIAEIKRASPSRGTICSEPNILFLSEQYQSGGAAAISVLTEEVYFGGSTKDLETVCQKIAIPVIRKDFIIDPLQIAQARCLGASAILLIVKMLEMEKLKSLLDYTRELGMDALVEVHDEQDLEVACSIGATIIGVNNRNLITLEVDSSRSLQIISKIPVECIAIAESGISSAEQLAEYALAGFDGALIGESFMRSTNPAQTIQQWLQYAMEKTGPNFCRTRKGEQ